MRPLHLRWRAEAPALSPAARAETGGADGEPSGGPLGLAERIGMPRAALLACLLVFVVSMTAYGVAGHYVERAGSSRVTDSNSHLTTNYYDFVDADGNVIDEGTTRIDVNNPPVEAPAGHTLDTVGEANRTIRQTQVTVANNPSTNVAPLRTSDKTDPILGAYSSKTGTWANDEPSLLSGFDRVKYWIVSAIAGLVRYVCKYGEWMLSLVDIEALLAADFTGLRRLYAVAVAVNNKIAVPYGSAFLTLSFVIEIVKLTDRRRYGGVVWFESFLRLTVMYAIAWTLVTHAMQIMEAIYWLGQNLYVGIAAAFGSPPTLTTLAKAVTRSTCEQMGEITYGEWWLVLSFIVIAAVLAVVEIRVVVNVVVTGALRMAEIYLRAAFAGLPMALVVGQDTRHIMVNYLKRFGACCFVGAVMVVAIALAGPVVDLVRGVVDATSAAEVMGGVIGANLVEVVPLALALHCVTGVVSKSTDVANGIFGV